MFRIGKKQNMPDYKQYIGRYNELAMEILKYCCSSAKGENVFVSPLSILLLLAIAADSAAGQTREEILNFLGNPDAGLMLSQLQKELLQNRSISVANAVCVRNDIAALVNRSYRDLQLPLYDAELFSSADMVKDINEWVRKKTNGMISNAAPESVRDALLCMLNAVAFESAWENPYMDYQVSDRYFINDDGTKSRVWMLQGSEDSYIENDDVTGFTKIYEDSGFAFMALLPKAEGWEALSAALDRIDFCRLWRLQRYCDVHTRLPEFRFDDDQELIPFCEAAGIHKLFTMDADLSPVAPVPLYAEEMLHKACIDVNQAGTRAAAVTMMAYPLGCAPMEREVKEVFLDRPFIFAIVHTGTGIPVFAGVVNHLENAKEDPERLKRKLRRNRWK